MNYTKNVLFLSAALMVLMMFYSCKDGNDPTEPEPTPPVVVDDAKFDIKSASDIEKYGADIDKEIAGNSPAKKKIIINVGQFGITSTQEQLMVKLFSWFEKDVNNNAYGVIVNSGNNFAVSAVGKIVLDGNSVSSWIRRFYDIGIKVLGTGEEWYASSLDVQALLSAMGYAVKFDGGKAGDITCNSEAEWDASIKEALKRLDDPNDKFTLAFNGAHSIDNIKSKLLDPLFEHPNYKNLTIVADPASARTFPATDSINVTYPEIFKEAFGASAEQSTLKDNRFYFMGDGKYEVAETFGWVRSDTANVTADPINRKVLPNKLINNDETYPFSMPDISDYSKTIEVVGLENPNIPGGKERPVGWKCGWYSTPTTRELGDAAGRLRFGYDPVITGTHTLSQEPYADVTGKDVRMLGTDTIRFYYGDFSGHKLNASNKEADKWAKDNGSPELFPSLGGKDILLKVWPVTFSREDLKKVWTWDSTPHGPANYFALVGLDAVQSVLKYAIKFSFEFWDKGNTGVFVRLSEMNIVMPDDLYNSGVYFDEIVDPLLRIERPGQIISEWLFGPDMYKDKTWWTVDFSY